MRPTLRELIIGTLKYGPYDNGSTAAQILCYLRFRGHDYVKLSSLSGVLKRMYDAGELERYEGFGPRGGYGYVLKREKPKHDHSAHLDYNDPYCPECGGNAYGMVTNPDYKPRTST